MITGPPGAGKTTLAVHWAGRHRDRWPDGQLYIDLRGYGPEPLVQPIEALAYFLRAIGLPTDQVPPQQAEASALFRSRIAGRRLLIVLDNAATVDQVRPLLPGGGDCLAIVTSRDRLTGLVAKEGARVLSVDVMADAEAQTLLSDAVGDARLAAEPDAAAALARLCGNLPLALRITAADLINHPQRSLTRHVDRLRTGNRLDALQVADDDGTAVRAAFRSSYARLPEPVRRLFRLLGLFPGSEIGLESAASLAGVEAAATEPLLDRLISAHLVTPRGAERFALHDLLRLFAQELGQEEDADAEREAATRRLYDHYSRVAVAAANRMYSFVVTLPLSEEAARIPVSFDDDTTASAWFDTEHPNLVALVRYAADRGDHLDACRLAATMQSYLHSKMHAVDWLNVARAYLFAARQIVDFRAQILAHLSLANLHRSRAQRNAAIKHFEQALALSRHSGWVDGQSITHNNLSGVYDYEGKLRLTVHHLHQALELRSPTRDITSKAVVLSNLGRALLRLGHVEDAVDHLERATNIHQRRGARVSESRSRASLGEALCELGQHHRALALLNHAVAVQRELDDRMFLPNTLCRLANAHLDVGQTDLAAELVPTAMALVRETGHRRSEAWVTYVTARVHEHTGCPDAALDGYAQALRLSRERGNGYLQVQAMIGMSSAHHQLGQRESARRCIDKALARARRFEYALLERQAEAVRVALS